MSIIFDLTGTNPDASSMVFTSDGLQLTVSTGLFNGDAGGDLQVYENSPVLNQDADGLGMLNPYGDFESFIDGHGKKELAILGFSQVVKITSITLTPLASPYNPTAEGMKFLTFGNGLVAAVSSTDIGTGNVTAVAMYGDLLGIGAHYQTDGFRIASITVEFPVSVAAADQATMTRGVPVLNLAVLANDTDARSVFSVDAAGLLGSVSIAADGQSVIYNNNGAFSGLSAGQFATEAFSYTLLGWDGLYHTENIEVLIRGVGGQNFVTGTSRANTLNGTVLGDTINGLSGNDTLFGGDGDDLLIGAAGKDILDGQAGGDEMLGGASNDIYYADDANDVVIELASEGYDSIFASISFALSANVEKLTLSGSADIGATGNASSNTLIGNDGVNTLNGGAGNDALDGGLGADVLIGGTGDDTFSVNEQGDQVVEFDSGGSDAVISSIGYLLGNYLENLTLAGADDIDGTGNSSRNTITGNAGANVLSGLGNADKLLGGLGNDLLIGGVGKDTLTGGGDADSFMFGESGSKNFDNVTDFVVGQDVIALLGSAFGLSVGALAVESLAFGIAATDPLHRIIYEQATGNIWFDADGSGAGGRTQIASLTGWLVLSFADFVVL